MIGDEPQVRNDPPAAIRPLIEADLLTLHRWYQTPELSRHLVDDIPARSAEQAVGFMRNWLAPDPCNLRFAVVRTRDGALLGRAALLGVEGGAADLHLFLGEPAMRGQGYGKAVVAALLAEAFERVGLETVRLKVLATNLPALALYRRFGFEPVGKRVGGAIKQGGPIDVIQMALHRHRRLTADQP